MSGPSPSRAAYDDLIRRLDRGEEPWLDPYAAEEPAEFFAVCAEMFFDVPEAFRTEYPRLYGQLAGVLQAGSPYSRKATIPGRPAT